jgi:hypothetical protein
MRSFGKVQKDLAELESKLISHSRYLEHRGTGSSHVITVTYVNIIISYYVPVALL